MQPLFEQQLLQQKQQLAQPKQMMQQLLQQKQQHPLPKQMMQQ
jgi:hypothetical protein